MTERSMSDAVADRSFSKMRQSCRGLKQDEGWHRLCVSPSWGWPSLGFGPFRTLFLTIQD